MWVEDDNDTPIRHITSSHTKVMVWGCIWYHGRSELCIVDGTVNSNKYMEILRDYLLPSMPSSSNFLFMHDNARPHVANVVRRWLYDNAVPLLEPWPAYSPDFNPIERVWSWMSAWVKKQRPNNIQSLTNAIEKAWMNLPQKTIQGYIDNLPSRVLKAYDAGGARID
jgi:transposase